MNTKHFDKPDFLFEVSWEVCNKVGGINTVIATKTLSISKVIESGYIMVGPDIHSGHLSTDIFTEDNNIYRQWAIKAREDGFNFRIGRWHIPGNPVAILLDFTQLFSKKDIVFKELWDKFNLDSLYGGWDYIEPALFGYEVARLIKHFYKHNVTSEDRIVAHFHEWMTGTGVLYLKEFVPQIGRVFTTHATVLGRSVAGMNMPLYSKMGDILPNDIARELNVSSKYSLEKLSAEHTDVFSTVSGITGNECRHFFNKIPDIITPNGFEDAIVPSEDNFENVRKNSREILKKLTASVIGKQPSEDALFVINSGRYEFRNKGIDLFVEAIAKLKNNINSQRDIVAVISVPANNAGVKHEVKNAMQNNCLQETRGNSTHYLFDEDNDAIINAIRKNDLFANPNSNVNIIFIPCYLDGNDGLINLDYYDFLAGFDVSVFPSYYEPWGYTPLEAVAFRIPTATTTLAGFGKWMLDAGKANGGVCVINRDDYNKDFVVDEIAKYINDIFNCSLEEYINRRDSAFEASREALWINLSKYYFEAYDLAIKKALLRKEKYVGKALPQEHLLEKKVIPAPNWRKIFVKPDLPENLKNLSKISKNLWWTWNHEAIALFESINPTLWEQSAYNPIAMLSLMNYAEISDLALNDDFLQKLDKIYDNFCKYMSRDANLERPSVAYFCMEYGFHVSMKLYSGGLGVLAGDYLKQSSDSCAKMTAVGLMFRYGYFNQTFTSSGDQISEYIPQKLSTLPMAAVRDGEGNWVKVSVKFPGRQIVAKVWKVMVGQVDLYLLDTDIDENSEQDKQITHQLYGGDWENRLKQEFLLGIGGVKLLKQLGLTFDVYHCNEGHAAFSILERLKNFVHDEVMSFQQALEVVRAQTLFTTHTPVPAGHDAFSEDMMRVYFSNFYEKLNISWREFMAMGRMDPENNDEKFSMSVLAFGGSVNVNGVSRIHGRVTREMFTNLFHGFFTEELFIDYVTNGVHLPTWTSPEFQNLSKEYGFDPLNKDQADPETWNFFNHIPEERIWDVRKILKSKLLQKLRNKLFIDMTHRQESPKFIMNVVEQLDENALYIGFARRFATYKRAHLLFKNLDKLSELVNDDKRPLRFVFAGKAHPADKAGQDYIKKIIEISHLPEFVGKIIFVENYDMEIAKYLVSGVDVWLNTPTRPLEASGTSGIKACLNGVLNLSVLDGWWAEGYVQKGGWALKEERTYSNQVLQDELDAETLYNIIKDDVVPLFFERNENNIPYEWIAYLRKNFTAIAPHFTMKRMIDEYFYKFYNPQAAMFKKLCENSYANARAITSWKRLFIRNWEQIKVIDINVHESLAKPLALGQDFAVSLSLEIGELRAEDLAIDVIFGQKEKDVVNKILFQTPMEIVSSERGKATFKVVIPNPQSGVFDYAFRLRPNNPMLPNKQDFNFVKWI